MNKLIILFASSDPNQGPLEEFADEYEAASSIPLFETRCFNLQKALEDGEMVLSKGILSTRVPAIYRGPRLDYMSYKLLVEAASKSGVTLMTDHWRYNDMHWFNFNNYHVVGEDHRDIPATSEISKDSSYTAFGSMRRKLCRKDGYYPVYNSTGENIIVKDLDSDKRVIVTAEKMTSELLSEIRRSHSIADKSWPYSNLIVQEFVDLKLYSGKSNEWRGWFFDGDMFALCPNSKQPPEAPKPPQWLIDKHKSESPFFEFDFAELSDGDWLIIGSDDGQVAKLASSQSAEDFYESFAKTVADAPHLPEWIWCLVANIDEDAIWTAPDGNTIRGTKHFRPGAKIYISSEWHGGYGDYTFVVMGKPRKQNRLIQIYMHHQHLCNFRLKKVYDKRVIDRMTRGDRGCPVLGKSRNAHGCWDNTDESKREIEEWVELLNRERSERLSGKKEAAD